MGQSYCGNLNFGAQQQIPLLCHGRFRSTVSSEGEESERQWNALSWAPLHHCLICLLEPSRQVFRLILQCLFVYFFCLWIKITSGYFLAKCIFIGIIYHLLLHFGKNGLPVCKTVPDRPAASSSLTWWQLSTSTLKYSCLFFMRAQNRNITHLLNSDIQIQRAVLGNTLFLHGSAHFHLFV